MRVGKRHLFPAQAAPTGLAERRSHLLQTGCVKPEAIRRYFPTGHGWPERLGNDD